MKKEIISIGLIIFLVGVFFSRLFYPNLSFFVTPDFGGSDSWQLNLPAKFFLNEVLKNNQLPFWNKYIGFGFPVLAEGQIGAFNLFNLLFFKLIPFPFAYNFSFVFIFIFTCLGTYFYLRLIKIHPLVSLFSALSFSFSAFFICHISHINLIQAASFLPWFFLIIEKILQKESLFYYFLLSFFVSQQIFSGFPQITFISLLTILIYIFLKKALENNNFSKHIFESLGLFLKICLFISLGFFISAIQIIPQFEFLRNSTRGEGFPLEEATRYSFSPKNLATLFSPRILGTPEDGSYPNLINSNFTIYWENNAFLGFLPVIGLLLGILLIKEKLIKNYFIILFFSFLMMLGKYSPLYVIYIFPPFSFFRVPSRFILIFIWSIIIISSLFFDFLIKKWGRKVKIGIFFLMIISLGNLFKFAYFYNPLWSAKEILNPPQTAQFLKSQQDGRFFLIPDYDLWNQVFTKSGWQDFSPFLFFKNNLNPNLNLLYEVSSGGVYPIQTTKRYNILNQIIIGGLKIENTKVEISDLAFKLFSLSNIRYLISPYEITKPIELTKVFETKSFSCFPSYKIYLNPYSFPRAYLVTSSTKVETVEQFIKILNEKGFNIQKTAIVENESLIKKNGNDKKEAKIIWKKDSHQEIILEVETPLEGILVLSDTYYPGWRVFVNNQEKEIFPVNLNFRGVALEKGKYEVKFIYQPKSFLLGKKISAITIVALLILFFWEKLKKKEKVEKSDNNN